MSLVAQLLGEEGEEPSRGRDLVDKAGSQPPWEGNWIPMSEADLTDWPNEGVERIRELPFVDQVWLSASGRSQAALRISDSVEKTFADGLRACEAMHHTVHFALHSFDIQEEDGRIWAKLRVVGPVCN